MIRSALHRGRARPARQPVLTKTIRLAIGDIRDAFDHLDEMPDQIDREHLLEVIDS
jgi:hypothetical protein